MVHICTIVYPVFVHFWGERGRGKGCGGGGGPLHLTVEFIVKGTSNYKMQVLKQIISLQ